MLARECGLLNELEAAQVAKAQLPETVDLVAADTVVDRVACAYTPASLAAALAPETTSRATRSTPRPS